MQSPLRWIVFHVTRKKQTFAVCDLPGNTLSGRFLSKLRTRALAVMLKICLGVKFTPSLAWKLNPPDMAPGNAIKIQIYIIIIKGKGCLKDSETDLLDFICCSFVSR